MKSVPVGFHGKWRWAALGLLCAGTAWAQGKVAVHPLVLDEVTEVEAQKLRAAFALKVASHRRVTVVPAEKVVEALAQEKGRACEVERVECLSRLAKAVGADRVAVVSVRLYPVVATGQVVTADGKSVAPPVVRKLDKVKKAKRLEAARTVMEAVWAELPLEEDAALLAPLVAQPEPPAAPAPAPAVAAAPALAPPASEPPAVVAVTPPNPATPVRKVAGVALVGAGVLAAGGALVLGLSGSAAGQQFSSAAGGAARREQELLALHRQAVSSGTAGLALGAVAVVAAGAGAVLWLGASPSAPVAVGLSPSGVVVAGALP